MIDILFIILAILILVLSMALHEFAHAFAARTLGDDTAEIEGRLSLNPIKHIDVQTTILLPLLLMIFNGPIFAAAKPVPVDKRKVKWGSFGISLVSAAGPVMNLLLAIFCTIVLGVFGMGGLVGRVAIIFMGTNINLFVFNLIPIPPLDGSKIIYSIAPDFVRVMLKNIEKSGYSIIIFIIFISPISYFVGKMNNFIMNFLLGFL